MRGAFVSYLELVIMRCKLMSRLKASVILLNVCDTVCVLTSSLQEFYFLTHG